MKPQKIIVMGGSFNPPTIAHLNLMQAAMDYLDAKKGIFVPANAPYVEKKMKALDLKKEVLSEEDRQHMLLEMCKGNQKLAVDTCEYQKGRNWHSYETMEYLQEQYRKAELYFIVGADKLKVISRWHKSREFLERFHILAVNRKEEHPQDMIKEHPFLVRYADSFTFLEQPESISAISSTDVRNRLRNADETVSEDLHPAVWEMLVEKGWFKKDITCFRGEYEYLSNFYEASVEYDGFTYGSNEAAFQAQKCKTREEKVSFTHMRPGMAKREGRKVALRSDWEEVKLGIMEELVRAKFHQHQDLAQKLVATKDRKIEERNTWHDLFWGVDDQTGQGENHLGKILMKIRKEEKGSVHILVYRMIDCMLDWGMEKVPEKGPFERVYVFIDVPNTNNAAQLAVEYTGGDRSLVVMAVRHGYDRVFKNIMMHGSRQEVIDYLHSKDAAEEIWQSIRKLSSRVDEEYL